MSSWDPHPRTAPGHSRSNKHWVYPISGDLQLVLYAKGGDRLESHSSPFPPLLDCVATDALLHLADLSHPIFS
jgi:hypothetical protein